MEDIEIGLEFTPNPNSLKYVINRVLVPRGAYNFKNPEEAKNSPLAQKLFELVTGVTAVTVGKNFITITKADTHEWDQIHHTSQQIMTAHLKEGLETVSLGAFENEKSSPAGELDKKIIAILDAEIRPAVAQDGGDVVFEKFENGVVYLHMEGSCSGCPSSTMTLKMGIETRLKELLPEVQEVVAV